MSGRGPTLPSSSFILNRRSSVVLPLCSLTYTAQVPLLVVCSPLCPPLASLPSSPAVFPLLSPSPRSASTASSPALRRGKGVGHYRRLHRSSLSPSTRLHSLHHPFHGLPALPLPLTPASYRSPCFRTPAGFSIVVVTIFRLAPYVNSRGRPPPRSGTGRRKRRKLWERGGQVVRCVEGRGGGE